MCAHPLDLCRKKHGKSGRQEIENSIGCSDSPPGGAGGDAFRSPDTVCRYCGEDFKFFRTLKHHLRSQHASCRSKPYECKMCTAGFSSKACCVRHIQKQHVSVSQGQLEECIRVNEMFLDARDDGPESDGESFHMESLNRGDCPHRPARSGSPQPPPAHTFSPVSFSRRHSNSSGTNSISGSPTVSYSDQPLDFSLKSAHSSPVANGYPLTPSSLNGVDDEPMDLSIHSRSGSSCESSPAPGALRTRGHGSPFTPSPYALQLSANVSKQALFAPHPFPFFPGAPGLMSAAEVFAAATSATAALMQHGYAHALEKQQQQQTSGGGFNSEGGDGLKNACGSMLLPTTTATATSAETGTTDSASAEETASKEDCASFFSCLHSAAALGKHVTATPDYGMLRYKREYQKFYNPTVGRLQCPFCKMLFKHGLKVCLGSFSWSKRHGLSCTDTVARNTTKHSNLTWFCLCCWATNQATNINFLVCLPFPPDSQVSHFRNSSHA